MSAPVLSDAELDLLLQVLDLARSGQTSELAQFIYSGIPVNLSNSAGDSLLILAAYYCRPETLLVAAAHPDTGGRSARQIATFFRLNDMSALLDDYPQDPHAQEAPG